MAQEVGYFENHVAYTEGPFVIVRIFNQWRIEVQHLGGPSGAPALTELSIDWLIQTELEQPVSKYDKMTATVICNWLNEQVMKGRIKRYGNVWEAVDFVGTTKAPPPLDWKKLYHPCPY